MTGIKNVANITLAACNALLSLENTIESYKIVLSVSFTILSNRYTSLSACYVNFLSIL